MAITEKHAKARGHKRPFKGGKLLDRDFSPIVLFVYEFMLNMCPIISSGNRETIQGTTIARHFKQIFASSFRYDENEVAVWPALTVNYTNKAQFLFRINKGIDNAYDNSTINKYTPEDERPIPFKNFVYIGDGETDIPAMKMATYQGGRSIVVYPKGRPGKRTAAHDLVKQHRADIAVPADYRRGTHLEKAVMAAIEQVAARHTFEQCDTSPLKGIRPRSDYGDVNHSWSSAAGGSISDAMALVCTAV